MHIQISNQEAALQMTPSSEKPRTGANPLEGQYPKRKRLIDLFGPASPRKLPRSISNPDVGAAKKEERMQLQCVKRKARILELFGPESPTKSSRIQKAKSTKITRAKMMACLLKYGVIKEKICPTKEKCFMLIHTAVQQDLCQVVKNLVDYGANVDAMDKYGNTPLHLAASLGFEKIVVFLLKSNASVSLMCGGSGPASRLTPLHMAIYNEHIGIVKHLLKAGARLNDLSQALSWAYKTDNEEIAKLLLTHHTSFDISDKSEAINLMGTAIWFGKKSLVEKILNQGVDINTVDPSGNTFLHFAESRKQEEIAKFLVSKGARRISCAA